MSYHRTVDDFAFFVRLKKWGKLTLLSFSAVVVIWILARRNHVVLLCKQQMSTKLVDARWRFLFIANIRLSWAENWLKKSTVHCSPVFTKFYLTFWVAGKIDVLVCSSKLKKPISLFGSFKSHHGWLGGIVIFDRSSSRKLLGTRSEIRIVKFVTTDTASASDFCRPPTTMRR